MKNDRTRTRAEKDRRTEGRAEGRGRTCMSSVYLSKSLPNCQIALLENRIEPNRNQTPKAQDMGNR